MTERDKTILRKIIEESSVVAKILHGLDEANFLANDEKQRATTMSLINIGELVKNLNEEFRLKHTQIPWKSIAGRRGGAAHG
jgi:uncharacterized protein with HEPN domain